MKRVETSLSDKQYAKALRVSKKRKVSMYALLKEALLGYLDTVVEKLDDTIDAVADKMTDTFGDQVERRRAEAIAHRLFVDEEFADKAREILASLDGKRYREATSENEKQAIYLLTIERIMELPLEKFNFFMASLELHFGLMYPPDDTDQSPKPP